MSKNADGLIDLKLVLSCLLDHRGASPADALQKLVAAHRRSDFPALP